MYIGIDFGTTTSRGAYVDASGEVRQIFNFALPGNTPPQLRYRYDGTEILASEDFAIGKMRNIAAEMRKAAENASHQNVDGVLLCLPKSLPSRSQIWDKQMSQKYKENRTNLSSDISNKDGRELVEMAVREAGIQCVGTIKESVAVVYAYGSENIAVDENVLVYDFGGNSFTATLLQKKKDNRFAVLAERMLADCGGNALDQPILEMAWNIVEESGKRIGSSWDVVNTKEARKQFNSGIDRMKRQLSRCGTADIVYKSSFLEVTDTFPQENFEALLAPLYQRTEAELEGLFEEGGVKKGDISRVLLAGGFSQVPYIWEHLEQFLGKHPDMLANTDAVSAMGAAIYAECFLETDISI